MTPDRSSVCVLIPVFDDQAGIDSTLDALGHDPSRLDILIVDDGGPEPVSCPARCGEHTVTLLRLEPNRGIEHALNAGLEEVLRLGYRYVARLDAGDIPLAGRFSQQVDFLDRHPEVGVVGTWAECVDEHGTYLFTMRFPTEHGAILRKQRYVPGLLHPTIMIRTEILPGVGRYSDRYKAAEDYDLFVRIGRRHGLANIPEALTRYVVSSSGTSVTKRRKTLISRLRIQATNFSWTDPHAYFGIVRTVIFLGLPFRALITIKRIVWK